MTIKKPPQASSLPISTFIIHKDSYQIDRTYQREANVWSKNDEQYLIDTILRGFGMPAIFIHSKEGYEYIVDGQQRINTIWKFKEGKLPLNEEYSQEIINDPENMSYNDGKPAYHYDELNLNWKNVFDGYPLPIINLSDYNDEEIRDLFRRLQRGKQLNTGEILNSYPGNIVLVMRKLGEHNFFSKILPVNPGRYRYNHITAQFMFLENMGIHDITPHYIYQFFKANENLSFDSDLYKRVNRVLNYLTDVFEKRTPELKRGWIITLYILASTLMKEYVMNHPVQKENLNKFFIDFYQSIPKTMSIEKLDDEELTNFSLAMGRATNNEKNIRTRHEIIKKRFLQQYNPSKLDEQRLFNEEQKIKIFRRDNEKCSVCGKTLNFGDKNTHYHHKIQYSKGGSTEIENGDLVCADCHLSVLHGKA